jgi:hypothetical protein
MKNKLISSVYQWVYNWAMGTKKKEEDLRLGTFYIHDWE